MACCQQHIARLEHRLAAEQQRRQEAEELAEHASADLHDRRRALELLETVAAASSEASTAEGALRGAIKSICGHTRWPVGHAYIVASAGTLVSSKVWHMDDPVAFEHFRELSEARSFAPGDGLPGRVATTCRPAGMVDTGSDESFPPDRSCAESGLRAVFALPVVAGNDVVAVIEIFNDHPTEVDRGLQSVAGQLGAQLGRVIECTRARQEIAHQSLHDGLTGLPNRVLFLDRLTNALARSSRSGALTGVLFINLDRFKVVNDSYGHAKGDGVLIEVGSRLDAALRPGDTIARLGGDEFVILCENLKDESEALRVAERLQRRMLRPFQPQPGDTHIITSSIGVAIGRVPQVDAETLLNDADAAMYRAKDLGRARHELFANAMRDRVLNRLRTERSLRRALDHSELRLHYQPIVSLLDRRDVEGVEALIRWQDPDGHLVPPDQFIPVAEESGLILRIGEWVLGEACRQAAEWRRELGARAPLPVHVNVAARQLGSEEFADVVRRALADASLDPQDLSLEITESALIEHAEVPSRTLAELRAIGVRVQLDDFGTGYSSLSYLQRFPVDALKIDRSFIAALGARSEASAIVGAIVAMGHALGLQVVAEGIETEDQVDEAVRLGCDSGQGHLFGRPLPAFSTRAAAVRRQMTLR